MAGAVQWLRGALALGPPPELMRTLLLELAEAEGPLSTEDAIGHLRQLRPLLDDKAEVVRVRLKIARLLVLQLRMTEALNEADEAVRAAVTPEQRLRAELTYVSISRQGLQTRPLGRVRLERLGAEVGPDDGVGRRVLGELAYERVLAGVPVQQVVETALAALGGPTLAAVHELSDLTRHVVLLSLCWCGEVRAAELAAQLILARARDRGDPIATASAHTILSNVHWQRGRVAESAAASGVVVEARVHGYTGTFPGAVGLRAQALAATGAIPEALATLELPGGAEAWSDSASFHGYLVGRARTLLFAGDHEGAYDAAIQCGTLAGVMGTVNPAVLPWRSLAARAAAAGGDLVTARALAEEELHLARGFGAPAPTALALRSVALTRNSEEAVDLIGRALALYQATPARLEWAAARLELAERLGQLGRIPEALDAAREARRGAESLGAGALAFGASAVADHLEEQLVRAPRPAVPGTRGGEAAAGVPAPGRGSGPAAQASEVKVGIRALGGFCVLDGQDRDVTPAGVPGKAVRILVGAGRPLHVEELAEELWPAGSDPEQMRARLRNVINRTRVPGLGPLLVRREDLVLLAPEAGVDADRFEQLAEAALDDAGGPDALQRALTASVLYGGDLLPTDPYADWAVARRERLRMRYLALIDLAARLADEAGLVDTAVNLLEAAIRHDPYDEQRYRRATAVLERAGRESAARLMVERADRVRRALEL